MTYFAFQGLLMAVLLLLFLSQDITVEGWTERLGFLIAILGASLVGLRAVSDETLKKWWFQAGLFLADAALATLILRWTHQETQLYLIYFLIIFGTAITRNYRQSMFVALVTSALFLASGWDPVNGFPKDSVFWLRLQFLWVISALMGILARDTWQSEREQESRFRVRLVEAERLATLGEVAGEVAHRIKGPLTTIMVNAEVLAYKHTGSPDVLRELEQIREEATHCKDILKNLLDLGRIEETDLNNMDLRDSIKSALRSITVQARKKGIDLRTSGLDRPLPVRGDQSLLHETFAAVLQNAVDACRKGDIIRISALQVGPAWWKGGSELISLVIEDSGRGMGPEQLEKAFKPFYTTKTGEGSGLGLSAALRVMQKHKGFIEASSEGAGKGTRFVLNLPRSPRRRRG